MRYLKDNHKVYLLLLVVILVFDSLLMLCNLDTSLIIYPNVIVLFIIIVYVIYDYYKYKNKHELLIKGFYDDVDCIFDEDYKRLINELEAKIRELETNNHKIKKEMSDYYSLLDLLIIDTIRYLRLEFIERKLSLKYEPINRTIITDKKWFKFVLKQLISNALKYTRKGSIEIYLEDNCLCIKDDGIGIKESDLRRIFEKGYTGSNGHDNKNSSGIGLYLCTNIVSNLGLKLSATSSVGIGSIFKIDLRQDEKVKD